MAWTYSALWYFLCLIYMSRCILVDLCLACYSRSEEFLEPPYHGKVVSVTPWQIAGLIMELNTYWTLLLLPQRKVEKYFLVFDVELSNMSTKQGILSLNRLFYHKLLMNFGEMVWPIGGVDIANLKIGSLKGLNICWC